jgi:hypothetical protein
VISDVRQALVEVDTQPGTLLHEVLLSKAPVDVVVGGLATNCTGEQYRALLEEMEPIAEQVVDKLNLP